MAFLSHAPPSGPDRPGTSAPSPWDTRRCRTASSGLSSRSIERSGSGARTGRLRDLDESNTEFPRTDVALVIGANDVTNPAARRPGNPVSGMPILDVDKARSVIVIKRSLGHGYAGIDNELYTDPRTAMLFSDAKTGLAGLLAGLHAYAA